MPKFACCFQSKKITTSPCWYDVIIVVWIFTFGTFEAPQSNRILFLLFFTASLLDFVLEFPGSSSTFFSFELQANHQSISISFTHLFIILNFKFISIMKFVLHRQSNQCRIIWILYSKRNACLFMLISNRILSPFLNVIIRRQHDVVVRQFFWVALKLYSSYYLFSIWEIIICTEQMFRLNQSIEIIFHPVRGFASGVENSTTTQ